jgi:hypothetical protein
VEHDDMTLERRLRAARPLSARVDQSAFDQDLLDRVRDLPIDRRRAVPRAVAIPVAAGATLTVAAVLMLSNGPAGPSSAEAITQALHWLTPAPGTVLHTRSTETQGGHTTTMEYWQSADRTADARLLVDGAQRYELQGPAVYDPATNTIYDPSAEKGLTSKSLPGKPGHSNAVPAGRLDPSKMPAGDPIVTKVRMLLQEKHMSVAGREVHNGVDAYKISLNHDAGRPVWTLWVSAANGKPLELRDPGRDANEAPQVISWSTYEVLQGSSAQATLRGAHPTAQVVTDPREVSAAEVRLGIMKVG